MLTTTKLGIVFLTVTSMTGICFSQTEAPKAPAAEQHKYFHLNFVVKELEQGKVINARAYSMMVPTENSAPPASIRSGSKVPMPTSPGSAQFNYVEVGVNIDCRAARELQNRLTLVVTADISRAASEPTSTGPLIHNTKWTSGVVVPFEKSTLLFSSDDVTTKRQLQLELTATPIK